MAVTAKWYGQGAKHLAQGDIDWAADTIKVRLLGAGYTFNQDTHEFASSLTSEVAAGAGYTTGGATLAGKSVTYDAATNRVRLLASDAVWTQGAGQTLSATQAVVLKDTGTAGTSVLLGHIDFGQTVSGTGDTFTIDWADDGVLYLNAL